MKRGTQHFSSQSKTRQNLSGAPNIGWSLVILCLCAITTLFAPAPLQAAVQQQTTQPQVHTVHITDSGFEPSALTVQAGDSVVWINDQANPVMLQSKIAYQIFLPVVQSSNGSQAIQQAAAETITTLDALLNPNTEENTVTTDMVKLEAAANGEELPPVLLTANAKISQKFPNSGVFVNTATGQTQFVCLITVNGTSQPDGTPTVTPTTSADSTATPTATSTVEGNPTTESPTATPDGTNGATATPTTSGNPATPTPTATVGGGNNATATATASQSNPTDTPTAANGTPATATATSQNSPTHTPTSQTATATPGGGNNPTATATNTTVPANTATVTNTPLPTNTHTATATRTPTRTPSPTRTPTVTQTPTVTSTPTSIYSPTPTETQLPTASPTALNSPTPEPTATTAPGLNALTTVVTITTDIVANTTWASGNVYVINGEIHVAPSTQLNIEAGVVVRFGTNTITNKAGKLIVDGKLNAQGATNNRIVFTSINDDRFGPDLQSNGASTWVKAGDWAGISFTDSSVGNVLNRVLIIGAGKAPEEASVTASNTTLNLTYSEVQMSASAGVLWQDGSLGDIRNSVINNNMTHGILLRGNARPHITDNTIVHNRQYAIYQDGSSFPQMSTNQIYGNGINGIGVYGGVTTGQWYLNDNLPYVVADTVTVSPTYKLTLPAGLVVKFQPGKKMVVQGALNALGTTNSPIVFTSLKNDLVGGDTQQDGAATKPTAGDWESLTFADSTNDAQTILDYVEISYGGSNGTTGALVLDASTPSLNHLTVMHNSGRGLYVQNAAPSLRNSAFSDNNIAILNDTLASTTITNSVFYMNSQFAISNTSTVNTVAAPQNWWGDGNGPYHSSNGGAIGDKVSDRVNFASWLTTTPFTLPTPLAIYPPSASSTSVAGTIGVNTTWTVAQSPYLVTSDVTVNAGIKLTIQPGVVVKFDTGKSLVINGILDAVGTVGQHIIFTSIKDDSVGGDSNGDKNASQPQPGDWARILFNSSSSNAQTKLHYSEIRYSGVRAPNVLHGIYADGASPSLQDNLIVKGAGYGIYVRNAGAPIIRNNLLLDNQAGGIFLEKASTPTVENNQFWGNGGFAVYSDGTCAPTFSGNIAYYNSTNGVRVAGTMTTQQSWQANLPYIIDQPLTVDTSGQLTLPPGTVVKFAYPGSYLKINGALVATGTQNSRVYFTSLHDDTVGGDVNNNSGATWALPSDWGYIYFTDTSNDAIDLIENATIRYGDDGMVEIQKAAPRILNNSIYSAGGYPLHIYDQATPQIQGNDIWGNSLGAVKIWNAAMPTLQSNHLHQNNSFVIDLEADSQPTLLTNQVDNNGVNAINIAGNLTGNLTWSLNNPVLPYAPDNVTIKPGSSLTMLPGTVVKFQPGTWWTLDGQLLVNGSAGNPVIFTSLLDDTVAGDSNADGTNSSPQRGDWQYIVFNSGASGSHINHASIQYGGMPTVKLVSTQVDIDNVLFDQNRQAVLATGSSGTLSNLTFTNNSEYAIHATNSTLNVHDSRFVDNQRGIYIRTSPANSPIMANNQFEDNTEYAYNTDSSAFYLLGGNNIFTTTVGNTMQIDNGSLMQANTRFYAGRVYQLGTVTALPTVTVTIDPGAILKFPLTSSTMVIQGKLNAGNKAGDPVIFTSFKDDSVGGDSNFDGSATAPAVGNWKELNLDDNAQAVLENVILRYGGSTKAIIYAPKNATLDIDASVVTLSKNTGILMNSNSGSSAANFYTATLTMTSTTVSNNVKSGILMDAYLRASIAPFGSGENNLSVNDSIITQNGDSGVYIDLTGSAQISTTDIVGNANYGVEALSTASVLADGNWWGAANGPAPAGSGDRITAYVSVNSFSSSEIHPTVLAASVVPVAESAVEKIFLPLVSR